MNLSGASYISVQGRAVAAMVFHAGAVITLKWNITGAPEGRFINNAVNRGVELER